MGRYQPNDTWARRAKEKKFRARSVFKLEELDQRFTLLRPGIRVLDCGAAPGSWLQYVSQKIGPRGTAIGIDLQKIDDIAPNVKTFVADIAEDETLKMFGGGPRFDLVLSDIAPSTSGIKDVDQWRSVELSQHVLRFALAYLRTGGNCAMKVLRGADFDHLLAQVKPHFSVVRIATVKATRENSREVYVVALRRKQDTERSVMQATLSAEDQTDS